MKVSLLSGGITVRGYEGKDVLVEAKNKDGKSEAVPKRAQGMKRIKPTGFWTHRRGREQCCDGIDGCFGT